MRIIGILALLATALPAHAGEWLVYPSSADGTTPGIFWQAKTEPVPGVNIPVGSIVKPFVADAADSYGRVERYKLTAGQPEYKSPPPLPETPAIPDIRGFKLDVFADAKVSPATKKLLGAYVGVINDYTSSELEVRTFWQLMVKPDLDQAEAARIEEIAGAHNITLSE